MKTHEYSTSDLRLSEQGADANAAVLPAEKRGEIAFAALELQRERRSRGVEAFIHPPTYPLRSILQSVHNVRPQHTPPASGANPRMQLQFRHAPRAPSPPLSSLAAWRYTSSHLSALRFWDGDSLDDSEEVRATRKTCVWSWRS